MSNKFTEKAEQALNSAVLLAEEFGHTYIGSEHILLSIAKNADSTAAVILKKNGITYDKVFNTLKDYSGIGSKSTLSPKDMTPRCRKIIESSYKISLRYGAEKIGTEHILLAILEEKDCIGVRIITFAGGDVLSVTDEILTVLRTAEKHYEDTKSKKNISESALLQYGKNLTELARKNLLDPVIGRTSETERLIRILCRKTKNNPCLIGEAGVGKTAIVEGLAFRIANGNIPLQLKGKSIISVDLTSMVAGAKYRGDFEERIKSMLNEAVKNKNVILFIDEIHTIVGAGSAEGAIDAANILKPQLSRGEIQLIGATTFAEYHKYIEKDAALERRFQPLTIEEPTKNQTIEMLKGLRNSYETHHSIRIADDAIVAAVSLAERYIQDRFFPDKAIDVIDEACARKTVVLKTANKETSKIYDKIQQIEEEKLDALKAQNYSLAVSLTNAEIDYKTELNTLKNEETSVEEQIDSKDIEEIINEITGIPISKLSSKLDIDMLEQNLNNRIYGQGEAINTLVMAIMRSEMGINNPDKPKGVFLFTGESGVGKTELAKAVSYELFQDRKSLIRYDMSEFSEKNSVTVLIGSPPGYVGYEDTGTLTEKIRRHPYSVVLFDEIEKAHSDVLNLLLQIMDDGILTDSCGRSVSFKNTYIIMTSNATNDMFSEKSMGFLYNSAKNSDALYDFFSPEFINRIDSIIKFSKLSRDAFFNIAKKKMKELSERLCAVGVKLYYTDSLCEYIADKAVNNKSGARIVAKIITAEIENPISVLISKEHADKINIEIIDNTLNITPFI